MKVGFLLNPIAGLGGKVALKGTDSQVNVEKAFKLGSEPVSPGRARIFLESLEKISQDVLQDLLFYTPPGIMGYSLLTQYEIKFEKINLDIENNHTTDLDTINTVKKFEQIGVDLIIFVGGDGTSVDIFKSIKKKIPILGVPSGVKTYGSVFTHSPEEAVSVLEYYYRNRDTQDADILDLNEKKYLSGKIDVKFFGVVQVPSYPIFFQLAKQRVLSSETEQESLEHITSEVLDQLQLVRDGTLLLIGPGSTLLPLGKKMNINLSLLGVDCLKKVNKNKFKLLCGDAREDQILSLLNEFSSVKVILTPIGGLGYLLGRGNHQLSDKVLNFITKDDLIVIATSQKLHTIKEGALRVDIYNDELNVTKKFLGYVKVITGRSEMKMMKVIH